MGGSSNGAPPGRPALTGRGRRGLTDGPPRPLTIPHRRADSHLRPSGTHCGPQPRTTPSYLTGARPRLRPRPQPHGAAAVAATASGASPRHSGLRMVRLRHEMPQAELITSAHGQIAGEILALQGWRTTSAPVWHDSCVTHRASRGRRAPQYTQR